METTSVPRQVNYYLDKKRKHWVSGGRDEKRKHGYCKEKKSGSTKSKIKDKKNTPTVSHQMNIRPYCSR